MRSTFIYLAQRKIWINFLSMFSFQRHFTIVNTAKGTLNTNITSRIKCIFDNNDESQMHKHIYRKWLRQRCILIKISVKATVYYEQWKEGTHNEPKYVSFKASTITRYKNIWCKREIFKLTMTTTKFVDFILPVAKLISI